MRVLFLRRNRRGTRGRGISYCETSEADSQQSLWDVARSYTGLTKALDFVEYGPTLALVGGRSAKAAMKRYAGFVEAGITESDDEFVEVLKTSRHAIGSDAFTDRVGQLYQKLIEGKSILEDVAFRKEVVPLAAGVVVEAVWRVLGVGEETIYRRQRNSMVRPLTAQALCKYAGMSQRDVAKVLNLRGGSAVSLQLRKLNEQLSHDATLRAEVDQIHQKLETLRNEGDSNC